MKMKRKEWKKLEETVQNLKMEIFGLTCIVRGIMACNEENKSYYDELDQLRVGLEGIDIDVSEKQFNFFISEYFLDNDEGLCGVMTFNVDATVEIINKLKDKLSKVETRILMGKSELTWELLFALEEFKEAFLNFMK